MSLYFNKDNDHSPTIVTIIIATVTFNSHCPPSSPSSYIPWPTPLPPLPCTPLPLTSLPLCPVSAGDGTGDRESEKKIQKLFTHTHTSAETELGTSIYRENKYTVHQSISDSSL